MKSLMRLWAFLLISTYGVVLVLPAVALAQTSSAPFPTCSITITPNVVLAGDSATIKWTSTDTNPTGNSITPTNGTVNLNNIGPSGNQQIAVPLAQITTYIGTFIGPGGTANCTASVQVSYGNANGLVNPNPTAPITSAANTGTPQPSIVQCGIGAGIGNSTSCQACNLAQLVQNIINFAIGVSIPIAALLFAWAGILYFTSGANPGNMERAKGIFSNALIGFLICITAWLVINTLLHALLDRGQAGFTSGNWFTIQCTGVRPIDKKINDIINSVLTPVNINALTSNASPGGSIITTGGGPACPTTSIYSATAGACSYEGGGFALPNGYNCPTNSTFTPSTGQCLDGESGLPVSSVSGSGTVAGASETVTVTLNNGTQQTFSCASCAPIPSDIPMKDPNAVCSSQVSGTCQADAGLIGQLEQLKSAYSGSWYVSEAWPPTVVHQSSDQNSGTSIDISACNANNQVTDTAAVGQCVQTFQTAATQSNLRAVYEVPTPAQRDSILAANPSANVIAVTGITGAHFSIYKK